MATTAEILIRSKDQFSALTDKAKRDMLELGRTTKQSMAQATDATRIFNQTLGLQLPEALQKVVAQSKIIGPTLAASFNAVAILGFVAVAGQIPELFEKMIAAVSGWDQEAKKAFENQIALNKRYVEALETSKRAQESLQVKAGMITPGDSLRTQLSRAEQALTVQQAEASRIEQELARRRGARVGGVLDVIGLTGIVSSEELATGLATAQKNAQELVGEIAKLKGELQSAEFDETAKWFQDASKRAEELQKRTAEWTATLRAANEQFARLIQTSSEWTAGRARGGFFDPNTFDPAAAAAQNVVGVQSIARERQEFFAQALQDFRNRTFGGGAGVEGGESANNLLAQRVIRQFEEAQAASERFVASFREGVGAIWDGFFVRGQGVLSSLANFAKGLLNSVGRTLFQNFATGLFTGGSGGGRGLASVAGNLGGGLGLSKIFGGAGGGLLGGLFGGGAAASSVPLAAIQGGFVPALPLSAIGGGVGAAAGGGGLAGALGFGGGAGLLGLGAATIPVFGGIALGAGLLLKHFLKGQPEAAFTRDPSEQRSVEYFFNTLPAVLGGVRDALDDFRNTYRPMSASQVLVAGMPGALQSSNQFRRNTMSILSDDL